MPRDYYRDHRDYILHLAVQLAQTTPAEMAVMKVSGRTCDLIKANQADYDEAAAVLLSLKGEMRTGDESPPAWWYESGRRAVYV